MSTAQLLGAGNARFARMKRREVLVDVRARMKLFRGHDRLELSAILADLEAVHKDSSLSGAQKDARFKAIINRAVRPRTPIA